MATRKLVKYNNSRRARSTRSIDPQIFEMLADRFDRVDQDNTDIKHEVQRHVSELKELFAKHRDDDEKVAAKVEKHSTYWGILAKVGAAMLAGVVAWFVAFTK